MYFYALKYNVFCKSRSNVITHEKQKFTALTITHIHHTVSLSSIEMLIADFPPHSQIQNCPRFGPRPPRIPLGPPNLPLEPPLDIPPPLPLLENPPLPPRLRNPPSG